MTDRVTEGDIRAALIDPIEALGWPRPKGMTAKAWNVGKSMLVERLAYLDAPELRVVAEDVLAAARVRKCMVPAGEIEARAKRLFPDPDEHKATDASIRRWMTCAEGRAAVAGDYAPEMLAYLRRNGPGFVFAPAIVTLWRKASVHRRTARENAARRGDTALVARIDAQGAEAAAMVESQGGER